MRRIHSRFGRAMSWLGWLCAACAVQLPTPAEGRTHPRLFGSYEFYSTAMTHFPRWTEMLDRQRREATDCRTATCTSEGWLPLVAQLEGKPLDAQLREVNDLINARRYVLDKDNWSDPDHWATPYEFLRKNGDCEDFAIAKYMALKAVGVPISTMRVVVLWDSKLKVGHAALVVYVRGETFLLDNRIAGVVRADTVGHYRAIYSINETGWWLHAYVVHAPPRILVISARHNNGG